MDDVKKLPEIEQRTFNVSELRAGEKDGNPTIEGYAAVFGEYSSDLGGFVEIIDPGFFDGVLDSDVRSLWNHDPNMILGRTTAGTLEISQDDKGLFQRTYLPATTWAQDALVSIKRGDVSQQSFAFRVKHTWNGDDVDGDEWYVLGELVVRRLKRGGCKELLDVSPVTYPAYPQTNVSASTRSRFETFKESLQRQEPEDGAGQEWQEPLDSLKRRLELKSKE